MPDKSPLVSVVIPTYNAPDLLLETLGGVFAQTFTNYEVVVVNDGSTDDTADRLKPLADAGRIRVVHQANGGIGVARNRGIEEARGKYLALLDHDDLWKPAKLERQVAFAQAHPECSLISVPWSWSGAPERCAFSFDLVAGDGTMSRPLKHMAHGATIFCTSTILFEKSTLGSARYGEPRNCIEDQQVHIDLLSKGKLGIAGTEILTVYRVHAGNFSARADYWDNGVRHLRALDAGGAFSRMEGEDREDLSAFLAHFGRTATALRLLRGERRKALAVYSAELRYQLRERSWKYLLAMPVLMGAPQKIIRKAFHAS